MKTLKILAVVLVVVTLAYCGSSKKSQASVTEDKPLFAAINALNKNPNNSKALADLPVLYKQSVERHRNAIDVYRNSADPARWDKMLTELNALQNIYTSLSSNTGTIGVVKPVNYLQDIEDVKSLAAEDYYNQGVGFLEKDGRSNSIQAYQLFQRSNQYINGYKDVSQKMNEAYQKSLLEVVINPIREDNLFYSSYYNSMNDFRYRPEEYQQSLARDLGGRNVNSSMARFYTDADAHRQNLNPDIVIDIVWRNMDPLRSVPSNFSRQRSQQVQTGTDTAGRPTYTTVYATVHVQQQQYSVRANLDYNIHDTRTNNNVDYGTIPDDVSWTESYATYSGDSRALTSEDWQLINNSRGLNNGPTRGDVMNTLMKKAYPDLRNRIQRAMENLLE